MKLTSQQLQQVEELASYFFSPEEVAIVLDVNSDELEIELFDQHSAVYKAYQRGKLKSKLELRKSILTLSKQGSGPAQTLAMRILDDLEASEL
jgi:uncharacterized protein (DUF2235 family)